MQSFEIEKVLSEDKTFIGCFAHDNVDSSVMIIAGGYDIEADHWVAVKMTIYYCFYFHSFVVDIVYKNINEFVS